MRKATGKKRRPKKAPSNAQEPRGPMISVYADGSSSGRSDEPGGYGWVITINGHPRAAGYGGHASTTNNRMEMQGILAGLQALKVSGLHLDGVPIEVVSDSQYALGVASGRYSPTKNLDIADPLKALCRELRVRFRWVRGHNKEPYNERCDSLAKMGKIEVLEALKKGDVDARREEVG